MIVGLVTSLRISNSKVSGQKVWSEVFYYLHTFGIAFEYLIGLGPAGVGGVGLPPVDCQHGDTDVRENRFTTWKRIRQKREEDENEEELSKVLK